ncbi:hypothetical protein [Candidatus Palauibacter soopunensis]|uniref:hypothetical protein n=1 Tax=Candidatus Palauibacter soopunensis TaxID=3056739 RepID=UPI00238D63E1|nr:hypothetical protein [Candidatus Palauibacter soopunensis]MDE2879380.1 hypothetical protein [Candidatus Palauibacter soopunensis]
MNGSDSAERRRSMYRKVLEALDEAQSRLERIAAEDSDERDVARSGAFHLGVAGGIAFRGRLPGIESEALFDDISDVAEERDPGRADRIRRGVVARLRPGQPPDESPLDEGGLDLEAGFLQMLAALKEARRAWGENDRFRHSLMLGLLTGLLGAWPALRYGPGDLADAVIAVRSRDPRNARRWLEAESIEAEEWRGESADTDERALLLRWVGDRLAAGHRFSEPLWCHPVDETDDERRTRKARARAYFERQETSIHRAQNFGKRIAAKDGEGIWIPTSYAINRALVLGSQEEE